MQAMPSMFGGQRQLGSSTTSTSVEYGAKNDINGASSSKRWPWLSFGFHISSRLVVLRARLLLLMLISMIIMLTAAITWKVAIQTTNNSFDGMSSQLREDVTLEAVNELKNMLNGLLVAMSSMKLALQGPKLEGRTPLYNREELSGSVLSAMWSVFQPNQDITTTCVVSSQSLISAYRRNGPESSLLQSPVGVAISPPSNDTTNSVYMYVPDANTGAPLTNGNMGKFCLPEQCPTPLDRSIYVQPFPSPVNHPGYWMGKDLPEGINRWTANVDGGMQPYLLVVNALKNEQGKTAAVSFITASSSRLQPLLQSTSLVKHYSGRMFITIGKNLNMLTASTGTLYMPPAVLGGNPSFISATNSSDHVIRAVATYLNATYAESVLADPIKDIMRVRGHGQYYVNSVPVQHEGLLLVVVLAVPREKFRGEIDNWHHKGLLIAMSVAIALFLLGGLIMGLSTTGLSQFLTIQGKKLDKAAEANEALTRRLAALTSGMSFSESPLWPRVDMGTPLEKLTAILKGLRRGHVMTQAQVDEIHALMSAEDLHRPEFLSSIQQGGPVNQGTPGAMDPLTGEWIEILATGRRMSVNIRRSSNISDLPQLSELPLGQSQPTRARKSSLDTSSNENSVGSSYTASGHSDDQVQEFPRTASSKVIDTTLVRASSKLIDATPARAKSMLATAAVHKACQCNLGTLPPLTPGEGKLASGKSKSVRLFAQPAPGVEDHAVGRLRRIAALSGPPAPWETPGYLPGASTALQVYAAGSAVGGDNIGESQHDLEAGVAAEGDWGGQVDLLCRVGEWDFDTLALAHASPDGVVPLVGFALFHKMGLINKFGINETKLANFLHGIGRGMEDHPYHNAVHVSDVSASLSHLVLESGVGDFLRPLDKLAAMCAALVHDYKHPGVNNDFLKRTREELATIYNDQSPLENFHLAEAFQLLYSNKHCNFLKKLSYAKFMDLRCVMIELVLASDLKRHFGVLDQFKARVSQDTPWDVRKESDRLLLMQMALKVADLGHAAKALPLHLEWSRRVTEEFYKQGDAERKLDLDVSPFMDRFNNNVPRSQFGFFQFLALPLFEAWVKAFPKSEHLVANAVVNIAHWKQELQATESKNGASPHAR